ncbi:hypothetical protein R3P38DRAFT_2473778, partial [Favolaschia claudopus]
CRRDREELKCKNPGKCGEVAKMLVNSLHPKWRPSTNGNDLLEELRLSSEEIVQNQQTIALDKAMTFDPSLQLRSLGDGFRIFASEE